MTTNSNYHEYINGYLTAIETGAVESSVELKQAAVLIRGKLEDPEVWLDVEKTNEAVRLMEKYHDIKLVDWELAVVALVHLYYTDDTLVFSEFFILVGRGNGKNKFIACLVWYLSTHYHGIQGYNVDIIANSQDQAKTSFGDVYEVLENHWDKLKKHFYKTKEIIRNLKTNSYIKFNTSNSKTKDGKRSGCLVFDEVHEYEDWSLINVFRSGFGKRKHSRIFYITTNGYVRGGILDELLDLSKKVLDGEIKTLRLLPLIYKIDSEEERDNPDMWVKANPSLPYFPELKIQMDQDFELAKHQPSMASEFMTKRMNFPAVENYALVAPWEKVLATNQPIPLDALKGQRCIGAFDYAEISDFASCGLLFKHGGKRYWIQHTFVCHKALKRESRKINFPIQEMADRGLMTIVYDDLIRPELISGWFLDKVKQYHVLDIVADKYRISILQEEFTKQGLPLSSVRSGPITHALVAPLIESLFAQETLVFGDDPVMRWAVGNTYTQIDNKGNLSYHKIEPERRKNDPFMALVHALTKDADLSDGSRTVMKLDVYTY